MSTTAYLALFGWIPCVFFLFVLLPGRWAAAVAVVGAWLLLPPYLIPVANFPDYSKNTAATIGMALSTLILRPDRVLGFRPRWLDLPILLWCFSGLVSSLYNGLGWYDGLSESLKEMVNWGLPYLLGRMYFGDPEGLRALTVAMAIGGLAYVLPCLYEIRMSPKLLGHVYGHTMWQGIRLGGYRPHVFFWTGLECGMWMTAATLTAWWLWRCRVLRQIGGAPFGAFLLLLMGTTVLGRSTGALVLLAAGIGLLWASTRFQTRILLCGLALFGPLYGGLRIPNLWSGRNVVELVRMGIDQERAQSLEYRFQCENQLIAKAVQQPVFGWGGWGRSAVYDENNHVVPIDGMWIVVLGTRGFFGLGLWYLVLELPVIWFLLHFPVATWTHPRVAAASVGATLLGLYMIDCTLNGFLNIIYVALAGGLAGLTPSRFEMSLPGGRRSSAVGRAGSPGRREAPTSQTIGRDKSIGLDRRNGPQQRALPSSSGTIHLADRCRSLGRALKTEGRLSEAENAWRQALDLLAGLSLAYPNDPDLQRRWCDVANDLAWLQLHHPDPALRDPAAAVVMASRAVETCANCAVYWNTLGVAYLRTGDVPSAIAALDRATALGDGGTAFDDVFLAMAHARLGDLEQARRRLAQAMVRMEHDHPGHPELIRFFDEAQALLLES